MKTIVFDISNKITIILSNQYALCPDSLSFRFGVLSLCSGSISGKSFEHVSTNLHKEATGTIQDKKNYREGLLFLLFLVLLW